MLGPLRVPEVTTHMMQHMHMPLIRYRKSVQWITSSFEGVAIKQHPQKQENSALPQDQSRALSDCGSTTTDSGMGHLTRTALSRVSSGFFSGLEPTPHIEPPEGEGLPNRRVVMQHVKERPLDLALPQLA